MGKYKIREELATGSTGTVRIGISKDGKRYAIKIINKRKRELKEIQKEIKIHSSLSHKNIIKFIESYEDEMSYYLVIRLAKSELFDLIEPGVGLDPHLAQFYMKQLISAVSYLHKRGVCHRDIKPENILLDSYGNLLLTDFGFSTLYKYKGKNRELNSMVGSFCYMAPEVLKRQNYEGDKIDIWSCGMVLLVMSCGETPWDKPTIEDPSFETYTQTKYHNYAPFSRISSEVLKLIKLMVNTDPTIRATIKVIENDPWFASSNNLMEKNGMCMNKEALFSYIKTKSQENFPAFSLPEKIKLSCNPDNGLIASQPTTSTFDLSFMNRIYLNGNVEEIAKTIVEMFDLLLVNCKYEPGMIKFNTVDNKRNQITGCVNIKKLVDSICVAFKRLKGDCLEFKKFFNIVSERLKFIYR